MAKKDKKSQEAQEQVENMNPEVETMQDPTVDPTEQVEDPTETPAEGEAPANETPEEKAKRLTREANLKTAKEEYVGHKCQYVPNEDYEFHDGDIVGAVVDAKGNVLIAIRTAEGKRITKKFGSKLLRVLPELSEKKPNTRSSEPKPEITDEVRKQHRDLVGYPCTLDDLEGRVRGIQEDKRTKQIYLTIHMADGTKRHTKITNENFKPLEADDETATIRENYFNVLGQRANGGKSSPENQTISGAAMFLKGYKQLVADGKIEETENLIACIEEIVEQVKTMKGTATQPEAGQQEAAEEQPEA